MAGLTHNATPDATPDITVAITNGPGNKKVRLLTQKDFTVPDLKNHRGELCKILECNNICDSCIINLIIKGDFHENTNRG